MIIQIGVPIDIISSFAMAGYFMYGLGSLLGGILADRFGESKIVSLCISLSGASTLLIFLFPNLVGFAIGFFIMSFWASFYHPSSYSMISKVYDKGLGTALGIHGASGSLGQIFAPATSVFVGFIFGWQYSFLVFGLLAILLGILLSRFHFEYSRENKFDRNVLADLLKTPFFWRLCLFTTFNGLIIRGVEFILPTFLVDVRFFDVLFAGLIASTLLMAGVIGQIVGGKGSDSFGSTRVLVLNSIGILFSLIILTFVSQPLIGVGLFVTIYGISMYATQPSFNHLTASVSRAQIRGALYGILFFLNFGVGSLSVFITGWISAKFTAGLSVIFLILLAFLGIMAALLLIKVKSSK
jgi:MFS family permease